MLSIVLTSFNRPDKLRRAISSVLEQSYEYFELIVSDDCSDYDIQELVKSFNDERAVFVRTPKNGGYQNNALFGLSFAKMKYVTFLCDDDEISDRGFYAEAVGIMESKDADMVFGRLSISSRYGVHLNRYDFEESYEPESFIEMFEDLRHNYHDFFGFGTCVFNREKFLKISPFRSVFENTITIDILNLIKYALECRTIIPIDKVVYTWNQSCEDSLSGSDKSNMPKQLIYNLAFPIDMYLYLQRSKPEYAEKLTPFLNRRIEYSFYAILADMENVSSGAYFSALASGGRLNSSDIYIYCRGWVGLALNKFLTDRGIKVKGFIDDYKSEGNTVTFADFESMSHENTAVIIASYKYRDIYKIYRKLLKLDNVKIFDLYGEDY